MHKIRLKSVDDIQKTIAIYAANPTQYRNMTGNVFEAYCHSVFKGFLPADLLQDEVYRAIPYECTLTLLNPLAGSRAQTSKAPVVDISVDLKIQPKIYQPAEKLNNESLDAVYEDDQRIYLLQMTIASSHPVAAKGIYEALSALDPEWTKGSFGASPKNKQVVLVFVVDKSRALANFGAQNIKFPPTYSETHNVSSIWGIGPVNTEKLAGMKIFTAGDLDKAIKAEVNGKLKEASRKLEQSYGQKLSDFKKGFDPTLRQWIEKMPQYRLIMPYDFSSILERSA